MNTHPQKPALLYPCDQCLQRKVRCDKSLPRCKRCVDSSLSCSRKIVRKRPGRKKGSGTVISKLRTDLEGTSDDIQDNKDARLESFSPAETERSTPSHELANVHHATAQPNSFPEAVRTKRLADETSPKSGKESRTASFTGPMSVTSESFSHPEPCEDATSLKHKEYFTVPFRVPGKVSTLYGSPMDLESPASIVSELMSDIDQFFNHLYPIWPIIDQASFRESLEHPEHIDSSQACLILSMCALSALHIPESLLSSEEPRRTRAQRFIRQCLQVRSSYEYIESATVITVQTSFFLSVAEVELQRVRSSWFLLREAIMLAQELGYYEVTTSPKPSFSENLSIQRTLYILSLTERGLTLLRNRPFAIVMFASPPNERYENEDYRVLIGLQSLSKLFNLLDKQFLELWMTGSAGSSTAETRSQITASQHTLASFQFDVDDLTDIQKVDILIARQWLRLVFWQLSMRQGLLSSSSEDPHLTYQFPCLVAKSLSVALRDISMSAIFLHGMAIFERIFEITYSFIDSLCLSQSLDSGLAELRVLFQVLRESPNSHNTYIKILETKLIEQTRDGGRVIIPQIYETTGTKI